jgi:hypothetical protein
MAFFVSIGVLQYLRETRLHGLTNRNNTDSLLVFLIEFDGAR